MNVPIVILAGARTPVGKFGGSLAGFSATDLGGFAVKEAVRRSGLQPEEIPLCIMGNVLQAGVGQNPARQAALKAGLSPSSSAFTVNMVCGSGLKAVNLAAQAIVLGEADCAVAGGMESMTNAPFILDKARWGSRLGHAKLIDIMLHDGLEDAYTHLHMGQAAEAVTQKYNVSREAMDRFAVRSHHLAAAAQSAGKFTDEVVPVEVKTDGKTSVFTADETIRADSSVEKLAALKPAFVKEGGAVTAGNASQINDAGAAVVLASKSFAESRGLKWMAEIVATAEGGVEPQWVLMAPEMALKNLEKKHGIGVKHLDLIEINEAFATQIVALQNLFAIPEEKLNANGGAIALGHPIGCSGARILVSLLYELQRRGSGTALETLCLGGGNAVATVIRR